MPFIFLEATCTLIPLEIRYLRKSIHWLLLKRSFPSAITVSLTVSHSLASRRVRRILENSSWEIRLITHLIGSEWIWMRRSTYVLRRHWMSMRWSCWNKGISQRLWHWADHELWHNKIPGDESWVRWLPKPLWMCWRRGGIFENGKTHNGSGVPWACSIRRNEISHIHPTHDCRPLCK